MRIALCLSFALLIGCTPSEEDAPVYDDPVDPAVETVSFAGAWSVDALPMDGDSALVTTTINAMETADGWNTVFSHLDEPVLANSVALAGDSAVVESGPFPSGLREGATVTSLTSVVYVSGDDISGHFTATYDIGEPTTFEGRLRGTRSN